MLKIWKHFLFDSVLRKGVKRRERFKMTSELPMAHAGRRSVKSRPYLTMHSAMSKLLLLPQFFGIFPLCGVTNNDIRCLHFKWVSFRVLYSTICIFGGAVTALFCLLKFCLHGLMLSKTATLAFYFCNVCGAIEFIKIAKNWTTIIKQWLIIDVAMRKYGFPPNLPKRFKIVSTVFMSLALCEHMLFIMNNLHFTINGMNLKNNTDNFPEGYFTVAFPHVFTLIQYSPIRAIFFEVANIWMTFAWNYTDLFIILLSISLALRFNQINRRLENSPIVHEKFWREVREDYTRLSRLCKTIDEHISPLVIISFVNNLFFICVQLYNSIKPRSGLIEGTYFFYSFGFLLIRTIAVTIYAAWINDESRRPLDVLHSVPSEYYGKEVNRFIEQIYTHPVGISGCKCYLVTRGLILRLAGTIVTFELMLLQFGPLLEDVNDQTMNSTTKISGD